MKLETVKLQTLFLVLGIVVFSPAVDAGGDRWLTRVDAAISQAEKSTSYILVDLYADWCGWCKVLDEEVFASPEFLEFSRDMVLLRVDVEDGAEGATLQARFKAFSLPTTLIIDHNMVKVGEIKGYAPTPRFLGEVSRQIEAHEKLLDSYDALRGGNNIEAMRQLAAEFHGRGDGARSAALYEAVLAKVEKEGQAVAWLHYLASDAHRLHGDFAKAKTHLAKAQKMSGGLADTALTEQIDMLRFYIAHDRGDCGEAVASLESFLETHPKSDYSSQARRALTAIRGGKGMECT